MSEIGVAIPEVTGSTETVLFVGGESLRQSILFSLRTSGYHLLIASRGEEALQLSLAYHGPIQMLVANIELPDMTGVDLAQRFAAQRPHVRVSLLGNLKSGTLVLDHGWQLLPATL